MGADNKGQDEHEPWEQSADILFDSEVTVLQPSIKSF